jgi:hypothetical protein
MGREEKFKTLWRKEVKFKELWGNKLKFKLQIRNSNDMLNGTED